MARWYDWRKGIWNVDTIADANGLKKSQTDPVFLLDRKTGMVSEYKIKGKSRKINIKNGQLVSKSYGTDDKWD